MGSLPFSAGGTRRVVVSLLLGRREPCQAGAHSGCLAATCGVAETGPAGVVWLLSGPRDTPLTVCLFFCGGTLLRRGASAHRRGNLGRPGRIGALRRSPCPGRRYPRWMTLPGERYPRPKRKIYICRRVSRTERMGTALRVAPVEGLTPCCPEPISYVDRNQTGSCSCPVAVFSEARRPVVGVSPPSWHRQSSRRAQLSMPTPAEHASQPP